MREQADILVLDEPTAAMDAEAEAEQRVATRSLVTPIVAHVLWDLGVLIVWPLIESRGAS